MEEKIKKLEEHLNFVWDLIPNKPTYGKFNKILPVGRNTEVLRNFEKENEWLGVARDDTKKEGISILNLFASITDYLTDGYRLGIITEAEKGTPVDDQVIIGFQFIKKEQ